MSDWNRFKPNTLINEEQIQYLPWNPNYRILDWAPPPNEYDRCVNSIISKQIELQAQGYPCAYRRNADGSDPWVRQPQGAVPFDFRQAINLPAPGFTSIVTEFYCPFGFDGVVNEVFHVWTGTGFNQGSGDLVWDYLLGDWPVYYTNVQTTFGSIERPYVLPQGGIRVKSGQRLAIQVTNSFTSTIPSDGKVIGSLRGWFYPC